MNENEPRVDTEDVKRIPAEAIAIISVDTPKILPCPFCGAAIWDTGCTHHPGIGELHYVWCWKCHVKSACTTNRDAAIKLWNRREATTLWKPCPSTSAK